MKHADLQSINAHEALQIRAIRDLRKTIHINDYGLPSGVYRVDLLPFHDYEEPRTLNEEDELRAPTSSPSLLSALPPEGAQAVPAAATETETETEGSVNIELITDDRVAGFRSQDLDCAFEPLEYGEGFPTFRNGDPFWLQLVCEPYEAFMAFQRYLQMSATLPADVPSAATKLKATTPINQDRTVPGATGFRSLALLASTMCSSDVDLLTFQEKLKMWSELYYWEWRAKAYDLFRVARHRQQQEIRAIETQDCHYSMARRLTAKIMQYIDTDEDFMDQMTPKVALDALKLTTALERVSAGLPAGGPAREGDVVSNSMEVTMRRVAQGGRVAGSGAEAGEGEEGALIDESGRLLADALQSPEDLRVMQEMILRFHSTSTTTH